MLFTKFLKDRKGGVAPLLALSIIPIMGTVGASVDYSRASDTRNAMQAALDSTALMLSKDAQTMSTADIASRATTLFNTNFHRPASTTVSVTTTLSNPSPGSFVLHMQGDSSVNTTFTRVLGQSEIPITASSDVVWGIKKLNLALVLDNTGSMAQNGKMTALKEAAHNLLTTMKSAAQNDGDVRVSIVPFATDVNVGTDNASASWVDWQDWDAAHGSNQTVNGNRTWVPASHSVWNGCIQDRDQNSDIRNTAPVAGSTSTMFPAHQASACPASMMSLSYDWTALNNKIDDMAPTGNTNTTIGLALGWQTLTATAPFNAPADASDLDKVIILLTDGENTQNRWTSSSSSIDARTSTLCTNIKNANIKIYTVRVIDGNSTLLRGCATKPSMYYEVSQAVQLNSTFGAIAQNLANLRIAK
jgi:Flp pilus assembly protein TadG